eukprot:864447-Prymnesium_polylepis.1
MREAQPPHPVGLGPLYPPNVFVELRVTRTVLSGVAALSVIALCFYDTRVVVVLVIAYAWHTSH